MSERSTVEGTMHIGAVAERTGLSLRTLRHYDEVGLLPPTGRTEGGFRLYTEADVERLLLIRRMKPLGFTLEETGELLALVDELSTGEASATARPRLEEFVGRALEQRAELAKKLAMADEFIALLQSR